MTVRREEPGSLAWPQSDEYATFQEYGSGNPGVMYRFDFGKSDVKGKTLEQMLRTNKKYVMWAIHPNRNRSSNLWYNRLVRAFKAYRKWERETGLDPGNRLWWFGRNMEMGRTFGWVYKNDYSYIEWLTAPGREDRHWYNEILRWIQDYERFHRVQPQLPPSPHDHPSAGNDELVWGLASLRVADPEESKPVRVRIVASRSSSPPPSFETATTPATVVPVVRDEKPVLHNNPLPPVDNKKSDSVDTPQSPVSNSGISPPIPEPTLVPSSEPKESETVPSQGEPIATRTRSKLKIVQGLQTLFTSATLPTPPFARREVRCA